MSGTLSPETALEVTGSVWPMGIGGAAIALAALVILARLVSGVVTAARRPGSLREAAAPAACVLAGILIRLTVTPTTAMWYAPVSPRSYRSTHPGVTTLLVWLDGIGHLAPFWWLAGAVWIAGLGCVWHAYHLAAEIGAPRPVAALTSLGLALWPEIVRLSTTDSPHVIALLFWMVAARAWVEGRARAFPAALVLLIALPFVARETIFWPLAAIALRPPLRGADPLDRGAAIVLAGAPLALGWAFGGDRPFLNPGSHDWVATPIAPLLVFIGESATLVGALAAAALAVIGLVDLARRKQAIVLPLVAVVIAPLLPMLIGAHPPENRLAMRYDLPCAFGAFALTGAGLVRLWARASRPLRVGAALALGCVLLVEWRAGLSTAGQYVFRPEMTFLRRQMAELPAGARVCVVDPRMSQSWTGPGRRRELAMSYSPGAVLEGGVPLVPWYLGRADVSLVAWGLAQGSDGCGWFFEGSVCHLAGDEDDPIARPDEALRFRGLCEEAHRALSLEETARALAPGRSYRDSRFDPDPVPLRFYRVRTP